MYYHNVRLKSLNVPVTAHRGSKRPHSLPPVHALYIPLITFSSNVEAIWLLLFAGSLGVQESGMPDWMKVGSAEGDGDDEPMEEEPPWRTQDTISHWQMAAVTSAHTSFVVLTTLGWRLITTLKRAYCAS